MADVIRTSKDRPADSAAREEAWHSFANSEPAPTHKDCFHAGWVSGKGYARLAPETSDIREQIRTGCDAALKFTMPTAVAEILGNIRALVSDRPAQKASACPKCDAVRKLGLTSCFEHAPTQKASSS